MESEPIEKQFADPPRPPSPNGRKRTIQEAVVKDVATILEKEKGDKVHKSDDADSDGGDAMCRYCFGGDEDGPLISPCECKGGQKYVHLSCLRRWQRMVLVSQPTHPAFYEDDVRHHKCNVCLSKFACPPPTRFELMSSFTGSELAAMIGVGFAIGSHEAFSKELEQQCEQMPLFRGNYEHWIRGSYIITGVEPDDVLRVRVGMKQQLETIRELVGDDLSMDIQERKFVLVNDGALAGKGETLEDLKNALKELQPPATLVFKSEQAGDCGEDHVSAVNLTRILRSCPKESIVRNAIKTVISKCKNVGAVEITHYRGGPCELDTLSTCIVITGSGQGWKIINSLKEALQLACFYASEEERHHGIARAQSVRLKDLKSCPELNGALGLALRFDKETNRWLVRLPNGSGKKIRPENLMPEGASTGRIMCFWGDARWSRTQLLGEIARGSWGLCCANVTDVIAPVQERWKLLYERLAFAPISAMSEDYMRNAGRHMNALRGNQLVPSAQTMDHAPEEEEAVQLSASHEDDESDNSSTLEE